VSGAAASAVSNLVRLLDLPDEVIELLQQGSLSEGHGRALLLAADHAARASLARSAVQESWSVRTVEARARERNAGAGEPARPHARRGRMTGAHPDQEEAAREIAEALAARSARRSASGRRATAATAQSCRHDPRRGARAGATTATARGRIVRPSISFYY